MKYVVYKDKLFIPHMQIDGTETYVPLENIKLFLGENEDPEKVLLPSYAKVIAAISEFKDTVANTKWYWEDDSATKLPTMAELNATYNSTSSEEALLVKAFDGSFVALSATVRDVTLQIEPTADFPDGEITLRTQPVEINDGITFIINKAGTFETAMFTVSGWQIDTSKNTIPLKFEEIDGTLVVLRDDVATLTTQLETQLSYVNSTFLKKDNSVNISTVLPTPINYQDRPAEQYGQRIATRNDVAKGLAELHVRLTTEENATSTMQGTLTATQNTATAASAKATDASSAVAALTPTVTKNSQDIAANKVILDGVKSQSDLDHQDLALIKTQTLPKVDEALAYARDWNTTKGDVAMKAEINSKATFQLFGRPITKTGTNAYKIDFAAWNGHPALDLSAQTTRTKAIINIHRVTATTPAQNRYNDLIDQHFGDATSDGVNTIYLADSISTLEKTAYVVSTIISATQATFSITKADGTAANLNAGQEAVLLAYVAESITFEGDGASVSASDDEARKRITVLQQSLDTTNQTVAGKQATLTSAQLAVVNGNAFTDTLKQTYDGYATTITDKQDKTLSSAVTGFTATTVEGALGELKTQATTNAGNISAEVTNRTNADAATLQSAKDFATAADATLKTTITTETDTKLATKLNKSGIAFYNGEIKIFNVEQPATSKFADTTLFDKSLVEVKPTLPALDNNLEYVVMINKTTNKLAIYSKERKVYVKWWDNGSQFRNYQVPITNNATITEKYISKEIYVYGGNGSKNFCVLPKDENTWLVGYDYSNNVVFNPANNTFTFPGYNYDSENKFSIKVETEKLTLIKDFDIEYKYIAKKDITFAEMGE